MNIVLTGCSGITQKKVRKLINKNIDCEIITFNFPPPTLNSFSMLDNNDKLVTNAARDIFFTYDDSLIIFTINLNLFSYSLHFLLEIIEINPNIIVVIDDKSNRSIIPDMEKFIELTGIPSFFMGDNKIFDKINAALEDKNQLAPIITDYKPYIRAEFEEIYKNASHIIPNSYNLLFSVLENDKWFYESYAFIKNLDTYELMEINGHTETSLDYLYQTEKITKEDIHKEHCRAIKERVNLITNEILTYDNKYLLAISSKIMLLLIILILTIIACDPLF